MFVVDHLDVVPRLLAEVYAQRIEPTATGTPTGSIRCAVGLFLVRDDGANGSKLAKEIVSSFKYWHARTGHYFDGIFLGWGYDAAPAYLDDAFITCVHEIEEKLDWKYQGGAHLILVDFVYDVDLRRGDLDFSRAVPLDLSKLLDEKKYSQLAPLIEEIIRPLGGTAVNEGKSPTWRVSDYMGVLRTRRFIWQELIKKLGSLIGWADDVANFAVRDLRRRGQM